MGDSLKKVRAGQRLEIPAPAWNAMIDAARAHKARDHGLAGPRHAAARAVTILPIKNSSGSDRGRFDVLGISGLIFDSADNLDEFKNNPAIDAFTPAAASHTGRFVILVEPIPKDRIGRGLLMGVCPVKIDVQAQADRYADVDDGQAGHLKSGALGAATILWKEAGTGEKWALVSVGAGVNAAAGTIPHVAKIVSNDGGGAYTIAPQIWDPDLYPPAWINDGVTVTGDGGPVSPNGDYARGGTFGGKVYYEIAGFAIWRDGTFWVISVAVDSMMAGGWERDSVEIEGTYYPFIYTGNPLVSPTSLSARDISQNANGVAGDFVFYWQQQDDNGDTATNILVPHPASGAVNYTYGGGCCDVVRGIKVDADKHVLEVYVNDAWVIHGD